MASAQNLVYNGGFEVPDASFDSFLVFNSGDLGITGWEVGNGSVDVVHQSFLSAPANQGVQFLDLDGSPGPGGISQQIMLEVGLVYQFSFAYANNYLASSGTKSAQASLFGTSGDLFGPVTVSHGTSASGNLDWFVYSTTFTATQSQATLQFLSLSPGPSSGGVLIDNVSLAVIPEPSPAVLLGFAAVSCAAFSRRRQGGFVS